MERKATTGEVVGGIAIIIGVWIAANVAIRLVAIFFILGDNTASNWFVMPAAAVLVYAYLKSEGSIRL